MDKTSFGDRMKYNYEEAYKLRLPSRMPVIIRLDGKSFHSFTKRIGAQKPFDALFIHTMSALARYLGQQVQTAQFAYVQSDEISLLLHPYKRLTTQPWLGNEIQKIVSVSAGMASQFVARSYKQEAVFDSRVFVLPEAEVVNYYIWRQQDAMRNSVAMLAQAHFGPSKLHQKGIKEQQAMLITGHGIDWSDLPAHKQRGLCVIKTDGGWVVDWDIPVFTDDREYIERFLRAEDVD